VPSLISNNPAMDIFGLPPRGAFLRFDGVKFETMEEVSNGAIRDDEAYTAMAGRGDYVWLTTRAAGLLLWKDREVTAFPFDRRCVTASLTNSMVRSDATEKRLMQWVRTLRMAPE